MVGKGNKFTPPDTPAYLCTPSYKPLYTFIHPSMYLNLPPSCTYTCNSMHFSDLHTPSTHPHTYFCAPLYTSVYLCAPLHTSMHLCTPPCTFHTPNHTPAHPSIYLLTPLHTLHIPLMHLYIPL